MIKISPASTKNFSIWKKTDSGHHACVTKQSAIRFSRNMVQAKNSTCLNQEFSITKENGHCTQCVLHKRICTPIFNNNCTSLKFQLPEVTISIFNSHHAYRTSQLPFKWNRWWGNWNNICKHPLSAAYIVMPVVRLEHTRTILQIWPAGTHRPKMHVKARCCHIGPSIKRRIFMTIFSAF